MPSADSMPAMKPAATSMLVPVPATLSGWGGGEGASGLLVSPADAGAVRAAVEQLSSPAGTGAIARGMGRSYGDAAQLRDGYVLDTTRLKGFQLDAEQGTVTTQAGVTIGELLRAAVPAGWMVPVVPGTQHVTVGGAIASDIHGKNHGTAGTFGSYVQALGLLTAAGEVLALEPGSHDGLFAATVGGMGLTGVIMWARIVLRKVSSSLLSVDTDRAHGLDHALELLSAPGGSHRVAWLDLIGSHPGRGIVTRAEHLDDAHAVARRDGATVRARATVPQWWPAGLLRASTVGALNAVRYRRSPRRERGHVEPLGAHMFPLDVLDAWPRLYGPHGFLQYQLVVPSGQERVLQAVIEHVRRARIPCFLAVLKDFGPANDWPLSFPIEGWTLTLDLPRAASGIDAALIRCDELVAEAGGRVYFSKDVRMSPAAVNAMYPRLEEWQAVRNRVDPEGLWRSDLALRTGLVRAEAR
jgi:decaprenylphospho-beta-D-ribofuranose 2-oxidase